MDPRDRIIEYVRRKYKERGRVPSIREILREFGIYRTLFYRIFPRGLREVCEEANVPLPEECAKLSKALGAKKRLLRERGDFEFEYKKSELEARVRELTR